MSNENQTFDNFSYFVFPQIQFGANQDDWDLWTMVAHLKVKQVFNGFKFGGSFFLYICSNTDLWVPFGPHILKACRVYKGEADKEDVLLI